jgi:N-acetyl-anhydromuramyl-L-alanine amidase AmpD
VRTSPLAPTGALGLVWHATGSVGGPRYAEGLARRIQTYRRGIDRAASWHVLISKTGVVYQSAPFAVGTWHVGKPGTVGGAQHPSVNAVTIGVELENAGDLARIQGAFYAWPYWLDRVLRKPDPRCRVASERVAYAGGRAYDAFPLAQLTSARELVQAVARYKGWGPEAFSYCHADFAAPAKTDPGELWRATLPALLEAAFKPQQDANLTNESAPVDPRPSPSPLPQLDQAVSDVLHELERSVVAVLKDGSRDGRLGASILSMLQRAALARVKAHLGSEGLEELARVLGLGAGAVDVVLGTRIDSAACEAWVPTGQPNTDVRA